MKVSEIAVADSIYRKWTKARSLLNTLRRRRAWHQKHSLLTPLHQTRYEAHLVLLRNIIDAPPSEINTSLSSRQMLNKPTAEILDYVFTGLKEPGPAQHDYFEASLVETMNLKGRKQRAATHRWHLECEVALRAKAGWFMIFNTLTVRPDAYWNVFNPASTAWQEYLRAIDRQLKRENETEYHSYFAAVEEGSQNGRLHIHVLHFSKHPPIRASDPNTGRARPDLREIACLKSAWRHGYSSPIAVRTSSNDAWGKIGWRWPLDRETGQGLKTQHPMKVAGYVGKYVTKTYLSEKRSAYLWRVRKSQRLGRPILEQMTHQIASTNLLRIASDPTINARINNRKIPPSLLRTACLREYLRRNPSGSTSLSELGRTIEPQPTLLQSFRALTQGTRSHSLPSSTVMKTLGIENEDTYRSAYRQLQTAAANIDRTYFAKTIQPNTTQSTRPYIR